MADPNLRARGTSEIVDAAFSLYRQHAMQYTVITAITYAPVLIINLLFVGGEAPTPATLVRAIPGLIAGIIALAVASAAISRMGADAYLGNPVDVGASVRAILPKLPAILVATLVVYLSIFVGAIFLLIPAIFVALRFFATSQIIVLEDKGPFAAMGRSAVLAKGRKMHIFSTLLLTWGIYFVLGLGISVLTKMTGNYVVQMVTSSVFAIFAYPIVNLAAMVLYYDTRIRAEGFDVEYMSRSMAPSPSIAPMGSVIS